MEMIKKPITTELQTIKLDFQKFYEICESHGVCKEEFLNKTLVYQSLQGFLFE